MHGHVSTVLHADSITISFFTESETQDAARPFHEVADRHGIVYGSHAPRISSRMNSPSCRTSS